MGNPFIEGLGGWDHLRLMAGSTWFSEKPQGALTSLEFDFIPGLVRGVVYRSGKYRVHYETIYDCPNRPVSHLIRRAFAIYLPEQDGYTAISSEIVSIRGLYYTPASAPQSELLRTSFKLATGIDLDLW